MRQARGCILQQFPTEWESLVLNFDGCSNFTTSMNELGEVERPEDWCNYGQMVVLLIDMYLLAFPVPQ